MFSRTINAKTMKALIHNFLANQNYRLRFIQRPLIYSLAMTLTILLCSSVFGPIKVNNSTNQKDEVSRAKMELPVLIEEQLSDIYQIKQNVTIQIGEDNFLSGNVLFAYPEFFELYDIDFIVGDQKLAFKDPKSVIITEEIADKIFKSKDPDCQIIRCGTQNVECQLKVTGVIKELPGNGGIEVDYIVSSYLLKNLEGN